MLFFVICLFVPWFMFLFWLFGLLHDWLIGFAISAFGRGEGSIDMIGYLDSHSFSHIFPVLSSF